MLTDKRLLPAYAAQIKRQASLPPSRPGLAGFTREAHEIHSLHITLTHLLRTSSRNYSIELPKGPKYPAEVLEAIADAEDIEDMHNDVKTATRRNRQGGER